MITIAQLLKRYGKIIALDSVNFNFKNDQVTGIMGENGAGKSTLLKICAGIIPLTSGTVNVDGFSIQKQSLEARKRIGFLPEMPYMYDRLTGREFLFYVASLRELDNSEETILHLSDLLGILDFLDYEIGTYSKGMKQKISIISALMHDPQNLLLDEPVWGLDPLTSRTLQKFIMDRKKTTILATHSPDLVEKVADIVYILMKGKILASEKVSTLKKTYGSIENAYFHFQEKT